MGARATIRIIQPYNTTPLHFYTHWSGHRVPYILAKGILNAEEGGRLRDCTYATRIIFDTLTELEGGTTGYGICVGDESQPGDVEYDTPTIQWDEHHNPPTVTYRGETADALEYARTMLGQVAALFA
jgi:hypothetical protein